MSWCKRVLSAFVVSTFVAAGASAAPLLFVEPPYQLIAGGAVTSVELRISGLGDGVAPSLGGFDFTILYDPAIISLVGIGFGLDLGDPRLLESLVFSDQPAAGEVLLQEVSLLDIAALDAAQPPGFVMVTLTFRGIGAGISPIDYSLVTLADASGGVLQADTASGAIEVLVPEPGTGGICGLLLAALVWRRRR